MSPDVLAGIAEVAELFGVTKQTALKYTRRRDFPKPLDRLAAGPVWKLSDVEAWAQDHRPKGGFPTGRPPRVTFNIAEPNATDVGEAAWLVQRLLERPQTAARMNAGLKIGAAVDGRSTVELTEQERRALVGVLNDLFAGAPQDPILTKRGAPERLRWLQQNLKRSLVDDVD